MSARHTALALAAALLLAACGGGSDAPNPDGSITSTSSAQAGDPRVGVRTLTLVLAGPVLHLDAPATADVQLVYRITQEATQDGNATVSTAMASPRFTGSGAAPLPLRRAEPQTATINYQIRMALPAGENQLGATVTVQAADIAGLPAAALAQATVVADWRVVLTP